MRFLKHGFHPLAMVGEIRTHAQPNHFSCLKLLTSPLRWAKFPTDGRPWDKIEELKLIGHSKLCQQHTVIMEKYILYAIQIAEASLPLKTLEKTYCTGGSWINQEKIPSPVPSCTEDTMLCWLDGWLNENALGCICIFIISSVFFLLN